MRRSQFRPDLSIDGMRPLAPLLHCRRTDPVAAGAGLRLPIRRELRADLDIDEAP